MLVQFPDGSTHIIPVAWTSQAEPDPTRLSEVEKNLCLSPYALKKVGDILTKYTNESL